MLVSFGKRVSVSARVGSIRLLTISAARDKPNGGAALKKIELVPKRLHEHLFGPLEGNRAASYGAEQESTSDEQVLSKMQLPELTVGSDLMKHFHNLGMEQFQGYDALLERAVKISALPKRPREWVMQKGWTAYDPRGNEAIPVEFPDEELLFFDVEICVKDGQLPTLAIALSPTKWYSWCSERLVDQNPVPDLPHLEHLIPLESPNEKAKGKKIVIGHNVAFDRTRVREQYHMKRTPARFWDTMSMTIAICGMADHQRIIYEQSDASRAASMSNDGEWISDWRQRVSKSSLEAVHSKFCSATSNLELKKELRDFFVKEDISAVGERFQELTDYCADDVQATLEVYKALYPIFKSRFTSPITYCGMLDMACAYLPVTSNWREFSEKCDELAEAKQGTARDIIKSAAELKEELLQDATDNSTKKYTQDPWMWCSDWSLHSKTREPLWYRKLFKSPRDMLLAVEELTAENVKMQCRDLPRIFGLCYGPYPLFYKADYGWGFLVSTTRAAKMGSEAPEPLVRLKRGEEVPFPSQAIHALIKKNRFDCVPEVLLRERSRPMSSIGIFDFYRLPHPSGRQVNVGSPFIKDYMNNFKEGILWATRFAPLLESMLASRGETRVWTNYRKRFNEQLAVWQDKEGTVGAIAPSIVPAGTVTRRAVHKLWLVSSNPKEGMIGSDLKSMVQCTEGYNLVGADVDSQEQWLAALFGDSITTERRAGSTAFSNMLLAGNKSEGSDLHSVVAKSVGISRENAKVLNYARLYGAGENSTVEFLKKSGTSESIARRQSEKLFSTTRGTVTTYRELHSGLVAEFKSFLDAECPPGYRDQHIYADDRYFIPIYRQVKGEQAMIFEKHMAEKDAVKPDNSDTTDRNMLCSKIYKNYPKEFSLYKDGFESSTFNFLELRSQENEPKTPILGCRLSAALEPLPPSVTNSAAFSRKYKRTVINWFVQSSAVDFLHLLLVSMNWLINRYKIDARFVISIHDEVRYLVKSEDRYRCALALVLSNMYVRAAISHQLGIDELPKSIAFFSQVDIDSVLRKEVTVPCRTPTGQLVPPGEALNVYQIIEKTGGSLQPSLDVSPNNAQSDPD